MKKITFLLTLLLTMAFSVKTIGQITVTEKRVIAGDAVTFSGLDDVADGTTPLLIKNVGRGWYLFESPYDHYLGGYTSSTGQVNTQYSKFYLIKDGDYYKIKNAVTGRFVPPSNDAISNKMTTTNGRTLAAVDNNGSTYSFRSSNQCWNGNSGGYGPSGGFVYWGNSPTDNSRYTIYKVTEEDLNYTIPAKFSTTAYYRIALTGRSGVYYLKASGSDTKINLTQDAFDYSAAQVWKTTASSSGVKIYSEGVGKYIAFYPSQSVRGDQISNAYTTDESAAVNFIPEDKDNGRYGFRTLAPLGTYLSNNGGTYYLVMGYYSTYDAGAQLEFEQVYKVTLNKADGTQVIRYANSSSDVASVLSGLDGGTNCYYWINGVNKSYAQIESAIDDIAADLTVDETYKAFDTEGNKLSDSKLYHITLRETKALTLNGTYFNVQTNDFTSTNQIWKIITVGDGTYKIKAYDDDDNYVRVNTFEEGAQKVSADAAAASAQTWECYWVSGNKFNIRTDNGSGTMFYLSNHGGGSNNMGFYNTNTSGDEGSLFQFTPVEERDYICQNLSGSLQLGSGSGFIDADVLLAPTFNGYTVSSATDDKDNDRIVFKYALTTTPITASTVESPVYFTIGQYGYANNYNFTYQSSDDRVMTNTTLSYPIANECLWYFVGSEENGYTIYNKAAGTSKWIGAASPTKNTQIKMTNDEAVKWDVIWNNTNNQYMLVHIGTKLYFNRSNNGGVYWDVVTGNGDNIAFANAMTLYGSRYPWSTYGTTAGSVGGYNIQTTEPTNVDDYATVASTINSGTKIAFNDSQYYLLNNINYGSYIVCAELTAGNYIAARKTVSEVIADPNIINGSLAPYWNVKYVSENTYTIQNAKTGLYITSIPVNPNTTPRVTLTETPTNITLTDEGFGKFFITRGEEYNDETYGMHENNETGITTWIPNMATSQFKFTPVGPLIENLQMLNPTTVASTYGDKTTDVYMSYNDSHSKNFLFPDYVTIYKVSAGGSKAEVNLVEVEDKKIPTNTGAIIKAKNGASIPRLLLTTTSAWTDNELIPGDGTQIESGYYLAYKKGETTPRFYLMEDYTVASNKAYLPANYLGDPVRELSLFFGDVETSVEKVELHNTNDQIYDLQGRRVQKTSKGLYIINGKKVFIK